MPKPVQYTKVVLTVAPIGIVNYTDANEEHRVNKQDDQQQENNEKQVQL